MKKISFILLASGFLSLCSCGNKGSNPQEMIEYYPVKAEAGESWGLVGTNGEMLVENEFKNKPTAVVNGYFSVEESNYYTLYKAGEKCEPVAGCDKLESVGVMMDGVIPVAQKGQRITVINSKGEILATLEPVGKKEISKTFPYFTEGLLAACTEEGKWGFVDKTGKTVVDFKYDKVGPYQDGLAIAKKEKDNGEDHYVILNNKGEETASIKHGVSPIAESFKDGYLSARDDDYRYGFINKNGEFTRLPGKVKGISEYNGKYCVFKNEDGDWGVISMKLEESEIIINAKYNELFLLDDNKFLASNEKNWFVINDKGDKELSFDDDYSLAYLNKNGKFKYLAKEGSHYIMLDKEGKPLNKLEFYDISINWNRGNVYSAYSKSQEPAEAVEVEPMAVESEEINSDSNNGVQHTAIAVVDASAAQGNSLPSGNLYYAGLIAGKYPIHMKINLTTGKGVYYYDKYGPSNLMDLTVTRKDAPMVELAEYDKHGKYCGEWNGVMSYNTYKGNGVFSGKEMSFDLTACSAEETGL